MGMYDTLYCKYPVPLDEELQGLSINWKDLDYQTKCLDNYLTVYYITETGELEENVIEREYIPWPEEETKKNAPWRGVWKDVIIKNSYFKKIDYHGTVNFYTSIPHSEKEDMWVEFKAYFVYGKLDKIELYETRKYKSSKLCTQEWIEECKNNEQKPWTKFKRLCGKFGWYYLWKKVAKFLCGLKNAIQNLEYFIYRKML